MLRSLVALVAALVGVLGFVACGAGSRPAVKRTAEGGTGGSSSLIVPIGASAGCTDTPDVPVPDGPDPLCLGAPAAISFQRDVIPLVHCSGEACHQAWTYRTLVGRASHACCDQRLIVSPGQPSASHLVQAISDVDSCVGRMGDLGTAQVATVVAWICEGAPDN